MTTTEIKRNILLEMNLRGFSDAAAQVREVEAALKRLASGQAANVAASGRTGAGLAFQESIVRRYARSYADATSAANQFSGALGGIEKGLNSVKSAASGLLAPLNALAGLVGGESIGFGSAIKYMYDFNKQIITTSGQFTKYGTGIGAVQQTMKKLSDATGLTQKESLGLMKTYEKGFNYISMQGAVNLMGKLKNAVGASTEAMQEMLSALSGIVAKFPDLEVGVTRLNSSDKDRLKTTNQMLLLTGNMSLAEAKRFQDYLEQNEQVKNSDKERKKEAESQIDAINQLKKVFEEVAMAINTTLMPYFKQFSQWVMKVKDQIMPYIPIVTKIALGFAVVGTVIGGVIPSLRLMYSLLSGMSKLVIRLPGIVRGGAGSFVSGSGVSGMGGGAAGVGQFVGAGAAPGAIGGAVGIAAGIATHHIYNQIVKSITGVKSMDQLKGYGGIATIGGRTLARTAVGAGTGAAAGALVGSAFFGVGAAPGAVIGGIIGGIGSFFYGIKQDVKDMATIYKRMKQEQQAIKDFAKDTYETWQKNKDSMIEGIDQMAKSIANFKPGTGGEEKDVKSATEEAVKAHDDYANYVKQAGSGGELTDENKAEIARLKGIADAADAKARAASDKLTNRNTADEKQGYDLAKKMAREDTAGKAMIAGDASAAGAGVAAKLRGGTYDYKEEALKREEMAKTLANQKITIDPEDIKTLSEAGIKISDTVSAADEGIISLKQASETIDEKIAKLSRQASKLSEKDKEGKIDPRSLAQAAGIQKEIDSLKNTKAHLDGNISDLTSKRVPIMSQLKAMEDQELAFLNEKKMLLESQVKLYQAMSQQVDSLIQRGNITGSVDPQAIQAATERAIENVDKEIEKEKDLLEIMKLKNEAQKAADDFGRRTNDATIDSHAAQLGINKPSSQMSAEDNYSAIIKLKTADMSDEDKEAVKNSLMDNARMVTKERVSQKEIERGQVELENKLINAEGKKLQEAIKVGEAYKGQRDYAQTLTSLAEAQVQLSDNLAVGFTASAQARMMVARQMDGIIDNLQKEKALLQEEYARRIKTEPEEKLLALKDAIAKKEVDIVNTQVKQAQTLKVIRDGWVGAVNAMTIGSGLIGKFVIDQNKNLGIGVKYLGVMRSMSSGGSGFGSNSVGARSPSGFSVGGFYGPGPGGMNRWATHDGGDKLADEVQLRTADLYQSAGGKFQSATDLFQISVNSLNKNINSMRDPNGQINKGGAGAFDIPGIIGRLFGSYDVGTQSVPGAKNKPRPALIHGKEQILSVAQIEALSHSLGIPDKELREHLASGDAQGWLKGKIALSHLSPQMREQFRLGVKSGDYGVNKTVPGAQHTPTQSPQNDPQVQPAGKPKADIPPATPPQQSAPANGQINTSPHTASTPNKSTTPSPAPGVMQSVPVWASDPEFANASTQQAIANVNANNAAVKKNADDAAAAELAAKKAAEAKAAAEKKTATSNRLLGASLDPNAVAGTEQWNAMTNKAKGGWYGKNNNGIRDMIEDIIMDRAAVLAKHIDNYDTIAGSFVDRTRATKISKGKEEFNADPFPKTFYTNYQEQIANLVPAVSDIPPELAKLNDPDGNDLVSFLTESANNAKDRNDLNQSDKYASVAKDRIKQLTAGQDILKTNSNRDNFLSYGSDAQNDLKDWQSRSMDESYWSGKRRSDNNLLSGWQKWHEAIDDQFGTDTNNFLFEQENLRKWWSGGDEMTRGASSSRSQSISDEIKNLTSVLDMYRAKRKTIGAEIEVKADQNERYPQLQQIIEERQKMLLGDGITVPENPEDLDISVPKQTKEWIDNTEKYTKLVTSLSSGLGEKDPDLQSYWKESLLNLQAQRDSELADKKETEAKKDAAAKEQIRKQQEKSAADASFTNSYWSDHHRWVDAGTRDFLESKGYTQDYFQKYSKKHNVDAAMNGLFVSGKGIKGPNGFDGPKNFAGLLEKGDIGAYVLGDKSGKPKSVFAVGLDDLPGEEDKRRAWRKRKDEIERKGGMGAYAKAVTDPPKHHMGGRVGGPEGSEQVIVAQGGERVSSISDVKGTNGAGGARGTITIQNLTVAFDELNVLGTKLKEKIEKEFQKNSGYGLSSSNGQYDSY